MGKNTKKQPERIIGNPKLGFHLRRLLAFFFDWYASTVLINIAIGVAYSLLYKASDIPTTIDVFSFTEMIGVFLLVIAVALLYYVGIPAKLWPGQTPGQKFTRVKVVNDNAEESTLSFSTHLLRIVVGCFIVEGAFYSVSSIFYQILTYHLLPFDVAMSDMVIGYATIGVGLLSLIIAAFDKKHRMLHDKISKTKVIDVLKIS